MRMPNREIVEQLRKDYPVGCKVKLLKMEDVQAPPIGTKGTVVGVDDTGSIMVDWENGSGLNVVYGEDYCKVIPAVVTICYGKREEWATRKQAEEEFLEAIMGTEGSEMERYFIVYAKLKMGCRVCSDEVGKYDE